ncbi:MAG: hypothetical protein KDC05_10450 [Bacteroidales bacterium]|nr:hypothetical protein [Bacteroidales bacterium]
MKSLNIFLLTLISLNVFSQISYDTTYSKEWNGKSAEWIYFDRNITSYDNGVVQSELIQVFENDLWVNYNENQFYYNNGLVIEELEKYWNDREEKWDNNYRKLYSYSAEGLLTSITHQYIFNGNYVNASREVMKYDEKGNLIEKIVQKNEEAWTNFLRYQYYYNASDLIMEENLTYWEGTAWGETDLILTHTYDMAGNLVEKVKSKLENSEYKFLVREEYIYGDNNLLEKQLISQWDSRRNKWIGKNRAEYQSDLNGYVASVLNQSKGKKTWENYLFTEFTGVNEPVTGLDITDGMSFTIYPVNFGKEAVIEFTNPYNEFYYVSVMNEKGEMMCSAVTSDDEVAIDATGFIRGMYFIELQGSNLYSGKFSIE